ncbi:hypothetical protein IJI31_05525 [bacterium]|nr:hypothetical protein [bacterium]
MTGNFENFDSTEASFRKSSVIQERVNLVSTHMYKQFLEYQRASVNGDEIFVKMINNLQEIVSSMKMAFSSRGVTAQNISLDYDSQKTVVVMNILWNKMSFTTRCNFSPQALYRENNLPLTSMRIMAIKGDYNELMKGVKDNNEEMGRLLDNEVASLYIPAEQTQNAIFKVKNLSNREFFLPQLDAAKEFPLKVIEVICGDVVHHEEGTRKSFNIV